MLRKLASIVLGIALALVIGTQYAVEVPTMHQEWLFDRVGRSVVLLRIPGKGGGTGVQIKMPSGEAVILTNDHICRATGVDALLTVETDRSESYSRRVLRQSKKTDLCLVEGVPGIPALKLGQDPRRGEKVYAVGHPGLNPLTITEGTVVGRRWLDIFDHEIDPNNPNDCTEPKYKKETLPFLFWEVEACLLHVNVWMGSILIRPGNSGSPLVNSRGRMVGLTFAGDSQGWGAFIALDDIKAFLNEPAN